MPPPTKLIALLTCLLFLAACGDDDNGAEVDDDHPHYNKCTTSCAADEDCADEEQSCLETCLARTEDLEGTCATCVSENFAVDKTCFGEEANQVDDGADAENDGNPDGSSSGGGCSCSIVEGTVSECESYCE